MCGTSSTTVSPGTTMTSGDNKCTTSLKKNSWSVSSTALLKRHLKGTLRVRITGPGKDQTICCRNGSEPRSPKTCKEVKRVRTAKGLWTKLEKWFGKPIIITSSSMASSSSSSRNSSSAIVEYPVVSEFVKRSLSVSQNNYSEWRQQMYSLIKSEGLLDLVSGAVEAPAKGVTITVSDAAGCGDKGVKDAQLQAWIRTTLSTDIPEHVVRSRTAKSMWTKLERIFGMIFS